MLVFGCLPSQQWVRKDRLNEKKQKSRRFANHQPKGIPHSAEWCRRGWDGKGMPGGDWFRGEWFGGLDAASACITRSGEKREPLLPLCP